MKKIVLLSALTTALLASFGAHAADTTELKVKGVIRPAACTPSFAGTNEVDYGTIAAKDIPTNDYKVLDEKILSFSVSCDASAKVTVSAIDNRASSAVPAATAKINSVFNSGYAFGLGAVDGKNIGGYVVRLVAGSFTGDNTSVDIIQSDNKGIGWAKSEAISAFYKGRVQSFATPGTVVPKDYKVMTGSLAVQAALNKGSELPLTQTIPLDGSATIEVKYL